MPRRAGLGATSFALRLAAIAFVPMVAVGILAIDRIEREREVVADGEQLAGEIALQQDIAVIYRPSQIERIALSGLASIDELGLPRQLVTEFSGVDLEEAYGGQIETFEERLDRLVRRHPSVVLPDGRQLADRVEEIRRAITEQRELSASFEATRQGVEDVFDELSEVLRSDLRVEGSRALSRPQELDALTGVITSAGTLAETVMGDILELSPGAVASAQAVHDVQVAEFRSLLDADEARRFDAALAVLVPTNGRVDDDLGLAIDPEYVAAMAQTILNQFDYLRALEDFSVEFHEAMLSDARAQVTEAEAAARRTIWLVSAITVIAVLSTLLLLLGTVSPILRLSQRARKIGKGDIDAEPLPVRGPRVIRRLTTAMNDMLVTLHGVERQIRGMSTGSTDTVDVDLPGAIGVSMRHSVQRLSDMTERLHRSEQLASAIVAQAADAIWTVDDAGIIRSANASTEALTGVAIAAQTGRPLADFLPGLDGQAEMCSTSGQIRQVLVSSASIESEIDTVTTVIAHDISERIRFEAELAHHARHDMLTGLPNRFAAMEQLEQLLAAGDEFALLFVDIDGFKGVNDTHGHEAGDEVLTEVARRLSDGTRETEFVARLGGDEFVVVQTDYEDIGEAVDLGHRLIREIERPYQYHHGSFSLSASVGVTGSNPNGTPLSTLREADNALYVAKQRGRGRVERFDASLQERVHHEAELALALREGIRAGELVVHLQPITTLSTGRIDSAEALVRWERPGLGTVPPGEFIPVAERSSLIFEVERAVLLDVCELLARWRRRDPSCHIRIAVNISGRHLIEGQLVEDLDLALAVTGADPSQLEFELTETHLLEDLAAATAVIDRLRSRGVTIAIDDFGTGYSSMTYLRDLPIDALKIDQSFVARSTEGGYDATVIDAVVTIASSLGLDIVAEGVETQEQLDFVRAHGCTRAQGYLLARPMPAVDAELLLFASVSAG